MNSPTIAARSASVAAASAAVAGAARGMTAGVTPQCCQCERESASVFPDGKNYTNTSVYL